MNVRGSGVGWISGGMNLVRLVLVLILVGAGCADPDVVLPETAEVEAWFDGAARVSLDEHRLRIEAVMEPEHLARGGSLWMRATPYFYLFNVHIRQVLVDYPDLAGVDVFVSGEDKNLLARVSLDRSAMTIYEWDRAVAYTSRAQREGTGRPRYVADLLTWAESRVEHEYAPR